MIFLHFTVPKKEATKVMEFSKGQSTKRGFKAYPKTKGWHKAPTF